MLRIFTHFDPEKTGGIGAGTRDFDKAPCDGQTLVSGNIPGRPLAEIGGGFDGEGSVDREVEAELHISARRIDLRSEEAGPVFRQGAR